MMKKKKVPIIRSVNFESVDEELSAAMAHLDVANVRVAEFLDTEKGTEEDTSVGGAVGQPSGETDTHPELAAGPRGLRRGSDG